MRKYPWLLIPVPFLLIIFIHLLNGNLVHSIYQNYNTSDPVYIALTLTSTCGGLVCGLLPLIVMLFEDAHRFHINLSSLIPAIICLIFVMTSVNIEVTVGEVILKKDWAFCILSGILLTSSFSFSTNENKLFKFSLKQMLTFLIIALAFYGIRFFSYYLLYFGPGRVIFSGERSLIYSTISTVSLLFQYGLIMLSGYVVTFNVPAESFMTIKYIRALLIVLIAFSIIILSGYIVQIPFAFLSAKIPVVFAPLTNIYRKFFTPITAIGFSVLIQTGIFLGLYKKHNKQIKKINKPLEANIM